MQPDIESLIADFTQRVRAMKSCVQLSQRKTGALMNGDLTLLEETVQAEHVLGAELLGFGPLDAMAAVNAGNHERLRHLRKALKDLAKQLQTIIRMNSALIAGGMDFSRTMLEAIYPPATYESLGHTPESVSRVPTESRISIKG